MVFLDSQVENCTDDEEDCEQTCERNLFSEKNKGPEGEKKRTGFHEGTGDAHW